MKRAILMGVLGLAAMSATAKASLIVGFTDVPAGTGGNDSTFDEVIVRITGWTGADSTTSGNGVTGLNGAFSANGGGVLSVPAKNTAPTHPFKFYITNSSGGLDAIGTTPASFANFDSLAGTPTRTPNSDTPISFSASWFTTGGSAPVNQPDTRLAPAPLPNNGGFDNTLLAEIFVTPGDTISFAGTYNSKAGVNQALAFTSPGVPEPASLGLLAAGFGGLMLRRRK